MIAVRCTGPAIVTLYFSWNNNSGKISWIVSDAMRMFHAKFQDLGGGASGSDHNVCVWTTIFYRTQ